MAKTVAKKDERQVTRPADPFDVLKAEMDRLFDEFRGPGFGLSRNLFNLQPFRGLASDYSVKSPDVNIAETDKAFEITAELPGMDEKDVEIGLANGVLTLKGEKKEEKEEKDKNYYLAERRYGAFQRSFRLPENVNEDKIAADFAKGVLTVTLPKRQPTKSQGREKKISIKSH